jgi:GNAT superfamily N-acetyltransferase
MHALPKGYRLRSPRIPDKWAILTIGYEDINPFTYLLLIISFVLPHGFICLYFPIAIVFLLPFYFFWFFGFVSSLSGELDAVIEYNGRLVAYIKVFRYPESSVLSFLFVARSHRCRGLGTCLVQQLIQKSARPIYVKSVSSAVVFYTRLGFVPVLKKKTSKYRTIRLVLL